ncbi:hypothetical protein [Gymnodinialimonas ceratoperidinii]|uniref:Uncharacterized protein n=1 Tax=Gymnodinialimonas ceratoperidinii TaxID=2856823 RepID=A0A8F6TUN1_9RHOB|nr:hypothetical protein [Gymnodinialimonas ceratoperidinii]QXT38773.1 hypothetical protein KYE46_12620 [Gymnodinialimonas ceratoperidinii]
MTARAAGVACAAALLSLGQPAMADGPALALLTLEGVTLTLTESAPPEIGARDVTLSFAQMHLGFPLPPRLSLTLSSSTPEAPFAEGAETSVMGITLNGAPGDGTGTVLGHETYLWFEPEDAVLRPVEGAGSGGSVVIETHAIARRALGQFRSLPVVIEVRRSSP